MPFPYPHTLTAMTNEMKHRRKYHYHPNKVFSENAFKYFQDYDKAISWALYLSMVPEHIVGELMNILAHSDYCNTERLSEIGTIYKKNQKLLSSHWWYFVDLHRLVDYYPTPSSEFIAKEVRDWVSTPINHSLPDYDFDSMFRAGCDQFLEDGYNTLKEKIVSIDDYLKDPFYWATPGSSDAARLYFEADGRKYKARKGKWATASTATLSYLKTLFYSNKGQVNHASPKREPSKPRMIISGDMSNYLRMGYVALWLESVLQRHPNTTLFYSTEQMLSMWLNMIKGTDGKHGVNLTLDESKFDRNVNTIMLKAMCESIEAFIRARAPYTIVNDLLFAWRLTMTSILNNGYVLIRSPQGNNIKIDIHNGILSGWRLTAFLDTMANIAKVNMYRCVTILRSGCLDQLLMDPIKLFTSQGDDIKAKSPSYYHAQLFTELYAESGFQVHPSKFFCSPYADEFLRKVAMDGDKLIGYPARGVSALLFRNPVTKDPPEGKDRIKEMANDWLQVARRTGARQSAFFPHMVRDISLGNNISKNVVNDILHARANLGGIGILPTNNLSVKIVKEAVRYKVSVAQPPILDEFFLNNNQKVLLTEQFHKGVEFGPHANREVTPYSIKVENTDANSNLKSAYYPSILPKVQAIFPNSRPSSKDKLTPMLAWLGKQETLRCNRQDIVSSAEGWMNDDSVSFLRRNLSKCSLRVIKEWITGDLLGSAPKSLIQGDIITPVIYNRVAANNLTGIFSSSKVTYRSVLRARLSAEVATHDILNNLPYTITD